MAAKGNVAADKAKIDLLQGGAKFWDELGQDLRRLSTPDLFSKSLAMACHCFSAKPDVFARIMRFVLAFEIAVSDVMLVLAGDREGEERTAALAGRLTHFLPASTACLDR